MLEQGIKPCARYWLPESAEGLVPPRCWAGLGARRFVASPRKEGPRSLGGQEVENALRPIALLQLFGRSPARTHLHPVFMPQRVCIRFFQSPSRGADAQLGDGLGDCRSSYDRFAIVLSGIFHAPRRDLTRASPCGARAV